jgi:hypothetical protein
MFVIAREKSLKSSIGFGVLALIMVLPILIYTLFSFAPSSAESLKQSQNILIYHRISHHAIAERWFDIWLLLKILMIIVALYLIRKTRIFFVVLISFAFTAALTAIQVITGSSFLALLFPWRISVLLVPLSFVIIVAAITHWVVGHFSSKGSFIKKIVVSLCLASILIVGVKGIDITKRTAHRIYSFKSFDIMKWVKDNHQKGDTYLVPPKTDHKFGRFRIFTGVPIFVDLLTHPYKDREVIEWYERICMAKKFYRSRRINYKILLNTFVKKYHINHVVLLKNKKRNIDPNILQELYQNSRYIVYRINHNI